MTPPKVNDILFTKDGRKIGNAVCINIETRTIPIIHTPVKVYWLKTDYGNVIKLTEYEFAYEPVTKRFYSTFGKASPDHKYYNYLESHPEELL